jgi:hypothetical protein
LSGGAYSVAWNGSLWVAAGEGTNTLAYSSDGKTWTGSANSDLIISELGLSVAWNGSLWVAGGGGTNTLAYSYDGIVWYASTNGNSILTPYVFSVAWNGSLWVAGGEGPNTLAYSYDGIFWYASTNGKSIITVLTHGLHSRRVLPYVGTSPTSIVSLLQNLGSTLPSGYTSLAYNPTTGVLGYYG